MFPERISLEFMLRSLIASKTETRVMDLHVGLGKGNSIECTLVPEVRKTGHGES
jgi:hypothetical protein